MKVEDLSAVVRVTSKGSVMCGPVEYNPHIPCDLQGGHEWIKTAGRNYNDVPITLEVCKKCGKVRA